MPQSSKVCTAPIVLCRSGGGAAVARRKLQYRFHNPNTVAETADYILALFIEANRQKVESTLENEIKIYDTKQALEEERSA